MAVQTAHNRWVVGSSPTGPTIQTKISFTNRRVDAPIFDSLLD